MLKRNILLLIISCCVVFTSSAQIVSEDNNGSGRKIIDKIVAQVGDSPIMLSEIKAQIVQMNEQGATVNDSTKCGILEKSLYQKLLQAQAKKDSLVVTDEQVNAEMENRLRVIENKIGGRDKLEAFYGKTYKQIKDQFREIIRGRMEAQQEENNIVKDAEVSPREVKEFFNGIPKDSVPYINEQLSIEQIVIYPKVSQASKEKAIKELQEWREEIISGKRSFKTMATLHSEDKGSAVNGGLIHASRGMMVKPFEAAALALKPGEVSQIVETQYGYHIIKLISRKGDDYTVRHILVTPEIGSKELSAAANLIDECYQRLEKHEITWNQAVKEYSEDKETRQNNGVLTNPYSGDQYWDVANINQIDPQIYSVVNGLSTGEISSPVLYTDRTSRKQGVRIVRIKNRIKPHKANLKDDYNYIKKAAESMKKSKVIEAWVKLHAPQTYIRIDDEWNKCPFHYKWK